MTTKFKKFHLLGRFLVIELMLVIPLCVACVLLYASLGRPVWIDEFLHFAFASFDTTTLAWTAITQSLVNVNHGQTGIYMLIDYWLLKFWGANVLLLRAPSLISAFLLCYFSGLTLRIRGYGLTWQVLSIFIMFCQSELMYFSGEARPYMPLAAASVGTLLYYLASPTQRSHAAVRFVGWISVLLGVLMHPYFSIYWLAITIFGLWVSWFNDGMRLTPSNIAKYLNLPLCVVGTFIYLTLASQTWLTGSPVFDRDPFQFMPQSDLFYLFVWHHSTFLGPNRGGEKFLIVSLIMLVIFTFLPMKFKNLVRPVIPPIILIYIALSLSALLSFLSYYQNYWILTRQWVASIALVAVGSTWFIAVSTTIFVKVLPNKKNKLAHFLIFILLFFYCWQLNLPKTKMLWDELTRYFSTVAINPRNGFPERINCPISPDTWVELANRNLAEGTPVWKIFKFYYISTGNTYCIE